MVSSLRPHYRAPRKERGAKAKEGGHLAGEPHGEMDEGDPMLLDFLNELYAVSVLCMVWVLSLKDCSDSLW